MVIQPSILTSEVKELPFQKEVVIHASTLRSEVEEFLIFEVFLCFSDFSDFSDLSDFLWFFSDFLDSLDSLDVLELELLYWSLKI